MSLTVMFSLDSMVKGLSQVLAVLEVCRLQYGWANMGCLELMLFSVAQFVFQFVPHSHLKVKTVPFLKSCCISIP